PQDLGIRIEWKVKPLSIRAANKVFDHESSLSIHRDPHHLDAHPQWVQLMALASAEMVIQVAALFVVEADPELFLVLGQLDFQWLAGLSAPPYFRPFRLTQQREGVVGLLGQDHLRRIHRDLGTARSVRSVDIDARLVAVAAVDEPAGPDADNVA